MTDSSIEYLKELIRQDDYHHEQVMALLPKVLHSDNINHSHPNKFTTVLGVAANKGRLQLCQILIEQYHADPQAGAILPLELAISNAHIEVARYLREFTELNAIQALMYDWFSSTTLSENKQKLEEIWVKFTQNPTLIIGWACAWNFIDELVVPMLKTDPDLLCTTLPTHGVFENLTIGHCLVYQQSYDLFFEFLTPAFDDCINLIPKSPISHLHPLVNEILTIFDNQDAFSHLNQLIITCPSINLNIPLLEISFETDQRVHHLTNMTIPWMLAKLNCFNSLKLALNLTINPIDVTACPKEHPNETLIYLCAQQQQWPLVEQLLPRYNIEDIYRWSPTDKNIAERFFDVLRGGLLNYRPWQRTVFIERKNINGVITKQLHYSNKQEYTTITLSIFKSLLEQHTRTRNRALIPKNIGNYFDNFTAMACFYLSTIVLEPKWGPLPLLQCLPKELRFAIAQHNMQSHFTELPPIVIKECLFDMGKVISQIEPHNLSSPSTPSAVKAIKATISMAISRRRTFFAEQFLAVDKHRAQHWNQLLNQSLYRHIERTGSSRFLQGPAVRKKIARCFAELPERTLATFLK